MDDETTVVKFIGGGLHSQEMQIRGSPLELVLPIRSHPSGLQTGEIIYRRRENNHAAYDFVGESGQPDTH